jgi:hypothetical protein
MVLDNYVSKSYFVLYFKAYNLGIWFMFVSIFPCILITFD